MFYRRGAHAGGMTLRPRPRAPPLGARAQLVAVVGIKGRGHLRHHLEVEVWHLIAAGVLLALSHATFLWHVGILVVWACASEEAQAGGSLSWADTWIQMSRSSADAAGAAAAASSSGPQGSAPGSRHD